MPVEATGEGNYASCFHADSSHLSHVLQHESCREGLWYRKILSSHDIILPVKNTLPEGNMIYQYGTSHP